MNQQSLTANEIRALLAELGSELDNVGVRGELFVVGGAAMALAYSSRRATSDVDAVFEPKAVIYEAAHRIAGRHGLPDDWLNDAMKGFLPGQDPNQRAVFEERGIRVSVPSPEYLLAMKVAAARIDRDRDDIETLAEICNASTSDDILSIAERIMGPNRLPPKAQFMVQEMFPDVAPETSQPDGSHQPRLGLSERLRGWAGRRKPAKATDVGRTEARPRPPIPTAPSNQGLCGARTARGGSCRNRRGSCPNHH